MMQTAEPWNGNDLATYIVMDLGFMSRGSSLLQSKMNSVS